MIRKIPFNSETSLRIRSREKTELPLHERKQFFWAGSHKILSGHNGCRLVYKWTSLHALARSCGPLSCTCFDVPDDADNRICLASAFPTDTIRVTGRAATPTREDTPWQSRTCAAAGLGIQELRWRQGRPTPAPDLRHQTPGSTHFCKQKVGVGYTRY